MAAKPAGCSSNPSRMAPSRQVITRSATSAARRPSCCRRNRAATSSRMASRYASTVAASGPPRGRAVSSRRIASTAPTMAAISAWRSTAPISTSGDAAPAARGGSGRPLSTTPAGTGSRRIDTEKSSRRRRPLRTNAATDRGRPGAPAAPGSSSFWPKVATQWDQSSPKPSPTPTRSAALNASRQVAIGQAGSVVARSSSS